MRILIVTQVFLPEMGALSNRMYPIVRGLVDAGHEVFVATGMPNYPEGKVFPGYIGQRTMDETMNDGGSDSRSNYTVLRTAYYTTPRNISKLKQLYSYLTFVPAVFRSGLRAGNIDAVLVTSPPIFPAIAAILIGKLRKAKIVFDIRDLWPDEIIACGAGREGSLSIRAIRAIERWVYRSVDMLSCTTQAFIETVVERGVPRDKTILTPNGADLDLFHPLPSDNKVSRCYPFDGRFVVMYSGLLGIKHGIETILEAAALLKHETGIVFFIRGNGPRRDALRELVARKGYENIIFGEERPIADLPHLIARAGVCVTSLLQDAYLEKIISVKIFEYLACGKPVIAALSGESARVIEQSGGGIVVPAGDASAMAAAILALYNDPCRRDQMGVVGKRYVTENYSRRVTAARLEQALRNLCGRGGDNIRIAANTPYVGGVSEDKLARGSTGRVAIGARAEESVK